MSDIKVLSSSSALLRTSSFREGVKENSERYKRCDTFRASTNTAILELTNKTIDRSDCSLLKPDLDKLKTLIESIGGEGELAEAVKDAYHDAMKRHHDNKIRESKEEEQLKQAFKNSKDTYNKENRERILAIEKSLIIFVNENTAKSKVLNIDTAQDNTVSSRSSNSTFLQNKRVTTSPNENNCGYYALAIGILGYAQQNPAKVMTVFNEINFKGPLTGDIAKDQLSLGEAIKQYFIVSDVKKTWIDTKLKEYKLEDPELKKEIRSTLEASSFISADYLQFMANQFGFIVRLNNAEEQSDGDNIRILNTDNYHYVGTMPNGVNTTQGTEETNYKNILDKFNKAISDHAFKEAAHGGDGSPVVSVSQFVSMFSQ